MHIIIQIDTFINNSLTFIASGIFNTNHVDLYYKLFYIEGTIIFIIFLSRICLMIVVQIYNDPIFLLIEYGIGKVLPKYFEWLLLDIDHFDRLFSVNIFETLV